MIPGSGLKFGEFLDPGFEVLDFLAEFGGLAALAGRQSIL
jgi:hypothetical protein